MIYTTNAIELLNVQLRKVTKNRGRFPNDAAVVKLLWLAICNIEDKRALEREHPRCIGHLTLPALIPAESEHSAGAVPPPPRWPGGAR